MTSHDTSTGTVPRPVTHAEAERLAVLAYDRFATMVEGLSEQEWELPTDCEGWTVRHLVGHMAGAMRSAASKREFFSQFREIKQRQKADGGNQIDVMTQVQIDRTSELSPDGIAAECRRLVVPAAQGRVRVPAPVRKYARFPVDLGSTVERWQLGYLNDVILTRDAWLHSVDLARAIGRPLEPVPELDGRVVEDVAAEWAGRHGAAYDLTLTGLVDAHYVSGGGAPDALEVDAVEFCRILSGRAPGAGLLATAVPF